MSSLNRITPLRVVDNVEAAALFYEAHGAQRINTDSPECVGYKTSSGTGVILTSRMLASANYGPEIAARLAQQGALYFYVDNIDAHLATLPTQSHLLTRTRVSAADEAVVDMGNELVVFASVA